MSLGALSPEAHEALAVAMNTIGGRSNSGEGGEDLKFSQKVADHIGSIHKQIIVSNELFINSIPEVIKDIESYDTTTVRASVGNWNIGKYIKTTSDAKVIFNGDGADELMGGYLYFHCAPNNNEFDMEIKRLLNGIGYRCDLNKLFNLKFKLVIEAFQRRFLPEKINGIIDGKVYSRILDVSKNA